MLRSDALDAWVGATVFVKAEHLQRTGAFKYRGATNAVQSLDVRRSGARCRRALVGQPRRRARARRAERGIPAYVVMPENTSRGEGRRRARATARRSHGATARSTRAAPRSPTCSRGPGAIEIHPFENPRVIAGAGTAARELLAEVPDLDVIVTPVGGGGLCSGTCIAVAPRRVIGGHPVDRHATIADGLRTGTSPVTEAILARARRRARRGRRSGDHATRKHAVWEHLHERIEPSAAVAFAAARASESRGARVGVICSGGNVAVSDP